VSTFPLSILRTLSNLDFDRLRPIDIEFMRKLHHKVNLIPVIAKADTLTDDEIAAFKQRVSFTTAPVNVCCRIS
jgi:septin family protein